MRCERRNRNRCRKRRKCSGIASKRFILSGSKRKANESLERLPDEEDEKLRQTLCMTDAPTSLDTDQMIAHLDQGERNTYNQLLSKVNGVDATHPGAPPRGMVMVDKPIRSNQ